MTNYMLAYQRVRFLALFQKYSYLVYLLFIINITTVIADPIMEKREVSSNMDNYINSFNIINETLAEVKNKDSKKFKSGLVLEYITNNLSKVDLNNIKNRQEYKKTRQKWLETNLEVVELLDLYYKADAPIIISALKILPPEIDGVYYPFPIDPKEIKDPKKRADYEQQIQTNKKNKREGDLQLILKRLLGKDPNLDPKASYIEELKKTIPTYYSEYAEDKEEYREIINQSSLNPARKQEFNELL